MLRPLLRPAELATRQQQIIPLDCSWFLPTVARSGRDEFTRQRIPRARFFDIDAVKDDESPYPHMLPSGRRFAEVMDSLGIRPHDEVCCYDSLGIFSAPRVWWSFRVFGHDKVSVLDGGLPAWIAAQYRLEGGDSDPIPRSPAGSYPIPHARRDLVKRYEEIVEVAVANNPATQLLDARPAGRFAGRDPEPRLELSSGHIPDSISVPFTELLDPETKSFRPPEQLRAIFADKGVDFRRPVTSLCGSGVTAAIVLLALEVAGKTSEVSLYDGSWTEWASRSDDTLILKEKTRSEPESSASKT